MTWNWPTFWYTILIILLITALVLTIRWLIYLVRKRRMEPSHVELYFDENFRKIIDEWDLVSRSSMKSFREDITKRLSSVGKDIDDLEKRKKNLNRKLTMVEKDITELEAA